MMINRSEKSHKERVLNFDTEKGSFNEKTEIEDLREKKAVIYCRVSSSKQEKEGNGLSSQKRKCEERCESKNIIVAKTFSEKGVSGAQTERKALRELLTYLQEKNNKYINIGYFVVSEASRISRPNDIAEAFTIEAEIKSHGVEIIRLDAPSIDDSTDEGHLFKTIQYAIAGYERKKIARRSSDGRRNRLLDGYRPFPKPPTGYLRNRISKKDYEDLIDEDKGPIIKKGLEMYATDVILSDADLRRYRSEQGLLSKAKGANKLQRTFVEKTMQLHRILFYAGYI